MNIDSLTLTLRSERALIKAGIDTVDKLRTVTSKDLRNMPNLGQKSVNEIMDQMFKLLSGEMISREMEWDKKYPPRPQNIDELRLKAKLYDKICNMIQSGE